MTIQCRNILMTELYHDEKKGITSGSTLTNEILGTAPSDLLMAGAIAQETTTDSNNPNNQLEYGKW